MPRIKLTRAIAVSVTIAAASGYFAAASVAATVAPPAAPRPNSTNGAFLGSVKNPEGRYVMPTPHDWDALTHEHAQVFEGDIAFGRTPAATWLQEVKNAGATPFVGINCSGVCPPVNKKFDSSAAPLDKAIKDYGRKVMIAWRPEANIGAVEQDPALFTSEWRRLHRDLSNDHNVVWVWQMSQWQPTRYPRLWPGQQFVNDVALDVFNNDGVKLTTMSCSPYDPHCLLTAVSSVRRLTADPIIIGSTGAEVNQCAGWHDLTAFNARHDLTGFIWFDSKSYALARRC